jgi:C-terminal processing protease CtpA/Prc
LEIVKLCCVLRQEILDPETALAPHHDDAGTLSKTGSIGVNRSDAKESRRRVFVTGIATQGGRPTVEGVEVGDKLVQIDGNKTRGASLCTIFSALHGKPGETRILTLERNGTEVAVQAQSPLSKSIITKTSRNTRTKKTN